MSESNEIKILYIEDNPYERMANWLENRAWNGVSVVINNSYSATEFIEEMLRTKVTYDAFLLDWSLEQWQHWRQVLNYMRKSSPDLLARVIINSSDNQFNIECREEGIKVVPKESKDELDAISRYLKEILWANNWE